MASDPRSRVWLHKRRWCLQCFQRPSRTDPETRETVAVAVSVIVVVVVVAVVVVGHR